MSSVKCNLGCCWLPVGCLDMVSDALFLAPGMCTMRNLYRSVFSLRFRSRELLIFSSDLSPKILSRGLWSTAIIRFSQPRTKCLDLSNASATARASPSIGAYLDSAEWVKRLPTRVIFHPDLQQNRLVSGHEQCFWNSQKPMPVCIYRISVRLGRFR